MEEGKEIQPMSEAHIMAALIEWERMAAGSEPVTMLELAKRAEKRAHKYLPPPVKRPHPDPR